MANADEIFAEARPRLSAVAYRMLGSAADAEDIVSEAYLRWRQIEPEQIAVPVAWLTKVTTNLCLNLLDSARVRRERYVGQWLPEPVLAGDEMLGPAESVELRESVTFALLLVLDRMSPRERAVYVLHEAFAYPHAEIAEMLAISESNSQQLLRRARHHVDIEGGVRHRAAAVDPAVARRVIEEFLEAAMSGKTEPLVRLLTEDAVAVGDGGGTVPARPKPVHGAAAVASFLRGLFKGTPAQLKYLGGAPEGYAAVANHAPALVIAVEGRVVGVVVLELASDGRVAAVRSAANPDKLARVAERWDDISAGAPVVSLPAR